MKLGDRHEIDNGWWEIVSRGVRTEDGGFDVREGRIPEDGDEGMLIAPDDPPEDDLDQAFWLQRVGVVEQRERVARLEMEMDSVIGAARDRLLAFEAEGAVPVATVASLMRAAAGAAYLYGINEEPCGALAERTGYDLDGKVVSG